MSAKNPFEPKHADASVLGDAETAVTESLEDARRSFALGRAGLGQLRDSHGPLAQATENVAKVARQLSEMVLRTSTELTRSGPAGRAFLPLVEQLADAARASLTAAHDLRRWTTEGNNRAHDLSALAEHTQAALDRLQPAVIALAAAAVPARGPAVEVIVRADGLPTDKASRVAELTEQALQLGNRRPSGPKN